MFRLTIVTCLVLGSALAKPPPEAQPPPAAKPALEVKPFDVEPVPYQQPLPYEDELEPIPFKEGDERVTIRLRPGRYYIRSPNFPRQYSNNLNIRLTVRGTDNQDISAFCYPFRMESHPFCAWDFLSLNGRKYCGTDRPRTTRVSELRIHMKTDSTVTASGFFCRIYIATSSTTGNCTCGLRQTRVVGGLDATPGQFPWQAGLVQPRGTRTFCGGSVINRRYVLTAAHCTVGSTASQIQVMLGDLRIGATDVGEQRYTVERITQHPQYRSVAGGWDFSLLKLSRDIIFTNTISPVCLPTAGQTYAGATAIASGYGRVGANQPQATTLQHVELPVWSQSSCAKVWSFINNSHICAGGFPTGGRSVCQGDSGGPLVTEVSGKFRLIGVVSFGRPCAFADVPDGFGRVTEALTWIATNTADVTTCTP